MGYHSEVFQLTRVDLTDKYYAMVAPLQKSESDNASRAATAGKVEARVGNVADTRVQFDNAAWSDQVLLAGIREWNLDDEAGKVLPITLDSIHALAGLHATRLLAAISNLTNPLANPETLKN